MDYFKNFYQNIKKEGKEELQQGKIFLLWQRQN